MRPLDPSSEVRSRELTYKKKSPSKLMIQQAYRLLGIAFMHQGQICPDCMLFFVGIFTISVE